MFVENSLQYTIVDIAFAQAVANLKAMICWRKRDWDGAGVICIVKGISRAISNAPKGLMLYFGPSVCLQNQLWAGLVWGIYGVS